MYIIFCISINQRTYLQIVFIHRVKYMEIIVLKLAADNQNSIPGLKKISVISIIMVIDLAANKKYKNGKTIVIFQINRNLVYNIIPTSPVTYPKAPLITHNKS